MDKTRLSKELRALAEDAANRSTIARLRDVIDDVEDALNAGVKRAVILQKLSECGLEMSLDQFNTYLARLRKKRRSAIKQNESGSVRLRETEQVNEHQENSTKGDTPSQRSPENEKTSPRKPVNIGEIMRSTPDMAALETMGKKLAKQRRVKK